MCFLRYTSSRSPDITSFEKLGNKTRLTLTHKGMPAGEIREQATAGWNESLDKLAHLVDKK